MSSLTGGYPKRLGSTILNVSEREPRGPLRSALWAAGRFTHVACLSQNTTQRKKKRMNTVDLFAGYDIHVSEDELNAEANLEDADLNADVALFATREVC